MNLFTVLLKMCIQINSNWNMEQLDKYKYQEKVDVLQQLKTEKEKLKMGLFFIAANVE